MKSTVLFMLMLAVSSCWSQKADNIVRDDYQSPDPDDGSYKWAIQTEGGIFHEQRGSLREAAGGSPPSLVVEGQYQYTAPDGQVINVLYRADENGFHAEGAHLPTAPPVPEAIQRALDYLATLPSTPPPDYL